MKTVRFKTNINCEGCIAKITPFLAEESEINTWSVDTTSREKVLIVETDKSADEIRRLVERAGFKAEAL